MIIEPRFSAKARAGQDVVGDFGEGRGEQAHDGERTGTRCSVVDGPARLAAKILVQDEQRLDAPGVDALPDEVEMIALLRDAEELDAVGVGIEIGAAQDAVGLAETRDDVAEDVLAAEGAAHLGQQERFLVGHAAGADDGDLAGLKFLQLLGEARNDLAPRHRHLALPDLGERARSAGPCPWM